VDPQLTTFQLNNFGMPVPALQFRENGMVFFRKGFTQPKQPFTGPATPMAHSFETLVAKAMTFLGVGTINDDLPAQLGPCVQFGAIEQPQCAPALRHLKEWTHFILATQLSTYPLY